MNKSLLICFFAFFINCSLLAQNTLGLVSYDPAKTYEGYNLIYPHNQPNVYLLNNCGEIVHQWEDDANFRPGNTAYLLEDGRLVSCKRDADFSADAIWAGGGGASVEIRDWDGNLEWSYTINDSLARLHHDIAPLPSGNILMIVWENKTREEAIQAGRDTSLLTDGELWPDYIIEVDPSNDEIVWEWHAWDHLIQDFDPTKDNYGVVADHPERININTFFPDGRADWMHSNAIDYNAELDQILLSVPTFSEVWIIDHSTTTAQAAGPTGGISGRGGDLMYRWGNPAAYNMGTADDQKLFYQHDAHWASPFLDLGDPNRGKIVLFNNRVSAEMSTVNVFNAGFDMYKNIYPMANGVFLPNDFDWTYTTPDPVDMYSNILSSIRFQPNGNALIGVGRWGYLFEITPEQEIVWEYRVPLIGGQAASQGDSLMINNNFNFRVERYPVDYPAFVGRDLSSKGYIEQNADSTFCSLILSTEMLVDDYQMKIFPNPAQDQLTIEWEAGRMVDVEVFNLMGQRITYFEASGGRKYLDTSTWENGIYFIQINQTALQKVLITR